MPVEAIYAWIETQPDGEERLVSAHMIPLVSASATAAEGFHDLVQKQVNLRGLPIDLVKFTARETVREVRKRGKGD